MKIIISHDVDHLSVREHLGDLIITKHLVRNMIELFTLKISLSEFFGRIILLFSNKWQNIKELHEFNTAQGIPATFFFGMGKGKGMVYPNNAAEKWIRYLIAANGRCGVHGIAFDQAEQILEEHHTFARISGLSSFGIRMHYLRNNSETLQMLARAGYAYDSSEYNMKSPYKVNGTMWEFPLHIMEGYEIEAGKKWQSVKKQTAINNTLKKIKAAETSGMPYLTILFHDRYFHSSFATWKTWYISVINYCKNEGYSFISYEDAIRELENSH